MSSYHLGILAGVCVAVIFVLIVIAIRKFSGKECADHYDERQLAVRYKAYKAGFFTLMICVAADAFIRMGGIIWCEAPLGDFIAIFIAVAVFAVISIMNDAFVATRGKTKPFILLYAAITVLQLFTAWRYFREGTLIVDGKLTMDSLSLFCGIMFLTVLIAILVKSREDQGEDDE